MSSNIYRTIYNSEKYGGNTSVRLTIEFINLTKEDYEDGIILWDWELILDGKRHIDYYIYENKKGYVSDGGCYYVTTDEQGNKVLDEPNKDYEEVDAIQHYVDTQWPLEKRENYILKKKLSPQAQETFGDIIDEL